MAKIVFTNTFLLELTEIIDYISVFYDKESAQRINDQILNSISLLENFPQSGHVMCYDDDKTIYRIIKGRYNIYYIYKGDLVQIISIVDAKRDTKYVH